MAGFFNNSFRAARPLLSLVGVTAVAAQKLHDTSPLNKIQPNPKEPSATFRWRGRDMRWPALPENAAPHVQRNNEDPVVLLAGGKRSPFGTIGGQLSRADWLNDVAAPVARHVFENTIKPVLDSEKLNPANVAVFGAVTLATAMGPLPSSVICAEIGMRPQTSATDMNGLCAGGSKALAAGANALTAGTTDVAVIMGMDFTSREPRAIQIPKGDNWPKASFTIDAQKKTLTIGEGARTKILPLKINPDNSYSAEDSGTTYKISGITRVDYLVDTDGYMEPDSGTRVFERADAAANQLNQQGVISRSALTQEALRDAINTLTHGDLRRQSILPISIPFNGTRMTVLDDEAASRLTKLGNIEKTVPKLAGLAARPILPGGILSAIDCSQQSDGFGALILTRHSVAAKLGLTDKISARVVAWGETASPVDDMSTQGFITAAKAACQQTGLIPKEIQVIECHKPFGHTTILVTAELGLNPARINGAGGSTTNKGHPPGATGIRLALDAETALHHLAKTEGYKGQYALLLIGGDGQHAANHPWAILQLPEEVPAQQAPTQLKPLVKEIA